MNRKKFRVDDLLKQKMSEKSSSDLFDLSIKIISIELRNQEDRDSVLKSSRSSGLTLTIKADTETRSGCTQELGHLTLDHFESRKSTHEKLALTSRNQTEFKINPQSFPSFQIQLKIGTKTQVVKHSFDKILSLGQTNSTNTDAIELTSKLETYEGAKNNLHIDDLISEFFESNQIRISVRKIPIVGKRNLNAIQTKQIPTNHANGSSMSKIRKEK